MNASKGAIRVTEIRFLWIRVSIKFEDSRPKTSQIGILCSGTQKCSQRFEIDHFGLGKISSLEPSKNVCESNRGTLRFTISISDILMAPSCSLKSFLEVGVSWAASRYSFQNLRFKHRGMQLGMWWYTNRINPHPQPPYQASAWSYRYFTETQ